jgi:neutral ceramidase
MNQVRYLKAGPSDASLRPRRPSQWQRSVQILFIFLLLVLGYVTFTNLFNNGEGQVWKWNNSGNEDGGRGKGLKGSQYLLGVGKADITG